MTSKHARGRPPLQKSHFLRSAVRTTAWAADSILGALMVLVNVVYKFWVRFVARFNARDPDELLSERLNSAHTYEQWHAIASELDMLHGNHLWKITHSSNLYDHKLIYSRLHSLRIARESNDIQSMIYLLRSGLLRSLGGLGDIRLFSQSFAGTKALIEDYLDEVVYQLHSICDTAYPGLTLHQKWEFFNETRQSFGNTALLLQGGATFGMYHLGVVKALGEQNLLPRIISGSSVGALIAALVCTHSDEELPTIFEPNGIDLRAFARKDVRGNISRKIARFLKHGYLMDVKVLEDCVRSNLGDITFEEAFQKTRRVLNITVAPSRKNELSRILNYLTAPNVLVRSAACASVSLVGLYKSVDLLAKDKNGNVFIWSPSLITREHAPHASESPESRLSELFNVNHFIVSQASPYIVPFMSSKGGTLLMRQSNTGTSGTIAGSNIGSSGSLFYGSESLSSRLYHAIQSEVRHRVTQIGELGLLPQSVLSLFGQKTSGHVTIAPQLSSMDFYTIFSNPTHGSLSYWILKGEQSTWPKISLIRNRTIIELTLFEVSNRVRATIERAQRDIVDGMLRDDSKKRNKSIA